MKIYPSNAGFCWGDVVLTEYSSGCLRNCLLNGHGIRSGTIPEIQQQVGRWHEDQYEQRLINEQPYAYHRELAFKGDVDGVVSSGRVDFITYEDSGPVIHETKASVNEKATRETKVKLGWLAQVTFYLTFFRTNVARITRGVYVPRENGFEKRSETTYTVNVSDSGQILVNDKYSGYNVQDQIEHQLNSAQVLKEGIVWERPDGAEDQWRSPCKYCAWQNVCNKWDMGEITTTEQFLEAARKAVK